MFRGCFHLSEGPFGPTFGSIFVQYQGPRTKTFALNQMRPLFIVFRQNKSIPCGGVIEFMTHTKAHDRGMATQLSTCMKAKQSHKSSTMG